MNNNDAATPMRDCLIGVVGNDADLERFRSERWYRIPERALGRSLSIDALHETRALALYQTGAITAGLPGAIELYANVTGVERLRRGDLLSQEPDHPAADEMYRVVRIDAPQPLERPIVSRRPRRLAFIRTTREHLLHAEDINDLIIGSPAEERLWRQIRDLGTERRVCVTIDGVVMDVDFAIFHGSQALGLICRDGHDASAASHPYDVPAWSILRFSPVQLDADLPSCIRRIHDALGRMRGA
jgi:hypothetical protein